MGKGTKKKTDEKLALAKEETKLKQRRLQQAEDGRLNVSDLRLNSLRFTFGQLVNLKGFCYFCIAVAIIL